LSDDTTVGMVGWQCEMCGEVYAEYVNGCPKCWHGEDEILGEPEVRSGVRAVAIPDSYPKGDEWKS
jgi:uncharacterized OB-fold protein